MPRFTEQSLLDEVQKVRNKLYIQFGRSHPHTKEEVRNGLTGVLTQPVPLEERLVNFVSFGTTVLVMYYEYIWDSPLRPEFVIAKLFESSKRDPGMGHNTPELVITGMINDSRPLNHTLHYAIAKVIRYLEKT